jgi:phosphoglycolate phosphatase-like HAD superfamily hydrolase
MSTSHPKVSKAEWLAACHFHDLSEKEVLAEVEARAKKATKPLVLLDLDSTLYEVGPRSHQILREWLSTSESNAFPAVKARLAKLEAHHVGYSLRDTFNAIGLSFDESEVHGAWEAAKKFWAARFFTHEYLRYDHAYPGAAVFAQRLYDLGTHIVYLTGRDEPGMGDGTRTKLIADKFPWNLPRTTLLMKKHASLPDLEHKLEAANYIRDHGTLIASFENEPANLSALCHAFPEAMHVYLDTVSSDHQAMVCQGLYRIKGFGT